jgi:ABC-2 type transport system ATP-binding protein
MAIVTRVSGVPATLDEGLRLISAPVTTGAIALIEVLRSLDGAGIHALDIALKRPSLDDVFMSLTGHGAEDEVVAQKSQKRIRRRT